MSTAWAGFLHESNAEMRRTRCHGGMTWTPSVSASTLESVSDYCQGFAWSGVSVREVIRATGSSPTQVRQALARLVEDGSLRVEEQMTRGRRASKRKVYFSFSSGQPLTLSALDDDDCIGVEEGRPIRLPGRSAHG